MERTILVSFLLLLCRPNGSAAENDAQPSPEAVRAFEWFGKLGFTDVKGQAISSAQDLPLSVHVNLVREE